MEEGPRAKSMRIDAPRGGVCEEVSLSPRGSVCKTAGAVQPILYIVFIYFESDHRDSWTQTHKTHTMLKRTNDWALIRPLERRDYLLFFAMFEHFYKLISVILQLWGSYYCYYYSLSVLRAHFFTCSYSCFVLSNCVSRIRVMMMMMTSGESPCPQISVAVLHSGCCCCSWWWRWCRAVGWMRNDDAIHIGIACIPCALLVGFRRAPATYCCRQRRRNNNW